VAAVLGRQSSCGGGVGFFSNMRDGTAFTMCAGKGVFLSETLPVNRSRHRAGCDCATPGTPVQPIKPRSLLPRCLTRGRSPCPSPRWRHT
jgi:hypothetical protein